MRDLLTVRLILEPGIAFNAVQMATDDERARVAVAWQAKQRVYDDSDAPPSERRAAFISTDLDFHRALVGSVHSELLEQLFSVTEAALELLIDLQMRARGYTHEMIGMEASHQLHLAVFEAFEAGDAAGIHAAMHRLIECAIEDAHEGFDRLKN